MKTYRIDNTQQQILVRNLVLRLALISGGVLVFAVVLAMFMMTRVPALSSGANSLIMVVAMAGLVVVIGVRLVNQVVNYRRVLQSIQFDLSETAITRRQWNMPDLTIERTDVTLMQETDAGILVVAKDRTRYLWAPAQLSSFAEVRNSLSSWMPIRKAPPQPGANTGLLTITWGIGTALCLALLLFSTDPWMVIVAGFAILVIYLFVYRQLRKGRGIDLRFRRTYSGVFLFLVVVVVAKLLMTITPLVTK